MRKSAHASTEPAAVPATAPTEVTWLANLDQGYKDAAKHQRPMLVIYGAEWCAPCRALQNQMQRPEVIAKLFTWTLVHIDIDKQEAGEAPFVGAIPALRLLTPTGKPITSREGYLSGEDLIRWLDESQPKSADADPDLAATGEPDAASTTRLIEKLFGRDAGLREAAIQRLAPWPNVASKAVADVFSHGNLRKRLAALDLLAEWKAPIDGIDPWSPETIDAARLDAIKKWAANVKAPTARPAPGAAALTAAELDLAALARSDDPADASVISARLARLGSPLLPQVLRHLAAATSDREREKLTALRYRLVATEALALGWPGGIERLAAADPQTRHAAAEELSKRAVAGDGPLLLELFSDADPLVRENSLRGLQAVGGENATAALVKLLHDPVANVRAAVLKQLAEQPSEQTTDAVIAYISQEKDADLVVHAVRVLKAAKGSAAVKCLVGLLAHESWRVRAETIDSLSDIHNARGGFIGATPPEVADAVLKCLDDSDGFVAGRALAAMKFLGRGASGQKLEDAIKRHPELAFDVIDMLKGERNNDGAAEKSLRVFLKNDNPAVRAAAIVAFAAVAPRNCDREVRIALKDKAALVRIAAANAMFDVLTAELPANGFVIRHKAATTQPADVEVVTGEFSATRPPSIRTAATLPAVTQVATTQGAATQVATSQPVPTPSDTTQWVIDSSGPFGAGDQYDPVDPAEWMKKFRAGEGRPAWYAACISDLQAMLKSDDRAQRIAAAFPLVALGHDSDALPIVLDAAKDGTAVPARVASLLPWLGWEQKLTLVKTVSTGADGAAAMGYIAEQLAVIPDPRAADTLWDFLTGPDSSDRISPVYTALRSIYRVGHFNPKNGTADEASQPLQVAVKVQLAHGNEMQKLVAMALGVGRVPEALSEARKIYLAPSTSDAMRLDAFQLMLLGDDAAQAQLAAAQALKPESAPAIRRLALHYLARGDEAVAMLHESIYMSYSMSESYPEAKPIIVKAPQGLSADTLTPFLKSDDPEEAADAGYLLCLLGKSEGLAPLLKSWNEQKAQTWNRVNRRVYQAIAALDDDSQTPVLEEVFKAYQQQSWEVRRFYWTIRSMHGPKVLALRKEIRDKVGMESLQ